MRLLLDTHTFLWWDEGKLPTKVVRAIRGAEQILVSAASAWEVAIKAGLGKIAVHGSFNDAVNDYGFDELPIRFNHAELVRALPPLHRDPFDRMLMAQAQTEEVPIISNDRIFDAYHVQRVW